MYWFLSLKTLLRTVHNSFAGFFSPALLYYENILCTCHSSKPPTTRELNKACGIEMPNIDPTEKIQSHGGRLQEKKRHKDGHSVLDLVLFACLKTFETLYSISHSPAFTTLYRLYSTSIVLCDFHFHTINIPKNLWFLIVSECCDFLFTWVRCAQRPVGDTTCIPIEMV